MQLINDSSISDKALNFIIDTIKEFNTCPLQYIKLDETINKDLSFYGRLRCKKRLWTMVCMVHRDWKYPVYDYLEIGIEDTPNWRQENKSIIFKNYDEAMLYVFFHEWFHFGRKTKQLLKRQYGKNTEANANKYALNKIKQYGTKK